MWYLIVPPIILAASLVLFFWLLSRKSSDPAVLGRIAENDRLPKPSRLLFMNEETGLRILEKGTKRLNLLSLKLHNRFRQASERLRNRREQVHEAHVEATLEAEKDRFWQRWQRRHGENSGDKMREQGAGEKKDLVTLLNDEQQGENRESVPEEKIHVHERNKRSGDSLVSSVKKEVLTRPFRRRRVAPMGEHHLSEEELIDRIARNPKDASAYEELGDYYMETDNLSDAKACYRQVIKLLPLNREVKEKVRRLERLLAQREKSRGEKS